MRYDQLAHATVTKTERMLKNLYEIVDFYLWSSEVVEVFLKSCSDMCHLSLMIFDQGAKCSDSTSPSFGHATDGCNTILKWICRYRDYKYIARHYVLVTLVKAYARHTPTHISACLLPLAYLYKSGYGSSCRDSRICRDWRGSTSTQMTQISKYSNFNGKFEQWACPD